MTKENQMDDLMQPVAWLDEEKRIIYWHNTHEVDDYHGFKRTLPLYTEEQMREYAKKAVEAERVEYQRLMEKHNNLHMNAHTTRQRVAELEEVAKLALEALERVEERETFFSYSYEIDHLHAALR